MDYEELACVRPMGKLVMVCLLCHGAQMVGWERGGVFVVPSR